MLEWISQNIATIIICAALIGVVAAIIAGMVRNKLKGKSSCGCGCSDCPMSSSCHSGKKSKGYPLLNLAEQLSRLISR